MTPTLSSRLHVIPIRKTNMELNSDLVAAGRDTTSALPIPAHARVARRYSGARTRSAMGGFCVGGGGRCDPGLDTGSISCLVVALTEESPALMRCLGSCYLVAFAIAFNQSVDIPELTKRGFPYFAIKNGSVSYASQKVNNRVAAFNSLHIATRDNGWRPGKRLRPLGDWSGGLNPCHSPAIPKSAGAVIRGSSQSIALGFDLESGTLPGILKREDHAYFALSIITFFKPPIEVNAGDQDPRAKLHGVVALCLPDLNEENGGCNERDKGQCAVDVNGNPIGIGKRIAPSHNSPFVGGIIVLVFAILCALVGTLMFGLTATDLRNCGSRKALALLSCVYIAAMTFLGALALMAVFAMST